MEPFEHETTRLDSRTHGVEAGETLGNDIRIDVGHHLEGLGKDRSRSGCLSGSVGASEHNYPGRRLGHPAASLPCWSGSEKSLSTARLLQLHRPVGVLQEGAPGLVLAVRQLQVQER